MSVLQINDQNLTINRNYLSTTQKKTNYLTVKTMLIAYSYCFSSLEIAAIINVKNIAATNIWSQQNITGCHLR